MDRETQNCEPHDLSAALCPSFNSYSSAAEVASRVVRIEDSPIDLVLHEEDDGEEGGFEFVSISKSPDGEFFIDGREIRPIFPVFDRDLVDRDDDDEDERSESEESIRASLKKMFIGDGDGREKLMPSSSIRVPVKKIFIKDDESESSSALNRAPAKKMFVGDEDDRDPPSSSCSEADDSERIGPGVYCFWTQKHESPSPPRRCEKSNSTGSSSATTSRRSRWCRLRDLLRRSNSEGSSKGSSLVFLTPSNPKKQNSSEAGSTKSKPKTTSSSSAHEKFYVRNRKMREEDKRRSYLPYRQDLVGFFANVNGSGRTFPPF